MGERSEPRGWYGVHHSAEKACNHAENASLLPAFHTHRFAVPPLRLRCPVFSLPTERLPRPPTAAHTAPSLYLPRQRSGSWPRERVLGAVIDRCGGGWEVTGGSRPSPTGRYEQSRRGGVSPPAFCIQHYALCILTASRSFFACIQIATGAKSRPLNTQISVKPWSLSSCTHSSNRKVKFATS